MGAQQTKQNNSQVFKVEDWQPIEWEPYTNNKDPTFSSNFSVYAHKNNPNLQIEKYQLFFNSQAEYVSYLETYYDRKRYPNLVNSIFIEQTTKKNMCSTFHTASVYLERIHFRLYQLIEIPVEEGLYMVQAALDGYQKMFQKTGYFQVSSDMIGVNKQGKVKVWVNKNFSKNFPQFNKIDHNKGEPEFIMHLIKVIQVCIDYPNNKETFSQFLLKKKLPITFENGRVALRQYLKMNRLTGQKVMKSILLWIKKNASRPICSTSQIISQFKTSSYNFSQLSVDRPDNYSRSNRQIKKSFPNSKNSQSQANAHPIKNQFNKLKTRRTNKPAQLNPKYYHSYPQQPILRQSQKQILMNREKQMPYDRGNMFNGAIHMSFIKNQRKLDEHEEAYFTDSNLKSFSKVNSKLPSVSFSYNYKSSGLYSPQNMQAKQQQWFKKKSQSKEIKQQFRKSLNVNPTQNSEIGKSELQVYYTNGDTHEIDPDIAKDLHTMKNIAN